MYLGIWRIDDVISFTVTTHTYSTGALTDADSAPAYRIYKDTSNTANLTGTMAKLDDTNTTGFYVAQITLSAANDFTVGNSYSIYIAATVGGVTTAQVRSFQIQADDDVLTQAVATRVWAYDPLNSSSLQAGDYLARAGLHVLLKGQIQEDTTATELVLSGSGISSVNDFYNGHLIHITDGGGIEQVRTIVDYDGGDQIATVDRALDVVPANGDHFEITKFAAAPTAAQINAEIVDVLRTDTLPDSYATDGAQPTIAQALLMVWQFLSERSVSGTTVTVKKPDGSTTAMTFTLSDATNPASITRAA